MAKWKPKLHPRDKIGRFARKSGGKKKGRRGPTPSAKKGVGRRIPSRVRDLSGGGLPKGF